MRHAILITTHDNVEISKNLLSLYDDKNIDFYFLKSFIVKYFCFLFCNNLKIFLICIIYKNLLLYKVGGIL